MCLKLALNLSCLFVFRVGTEIRSIFKWLKSLPVEMSSSPTFIRVVAQCVLGHVAAVTTMKPQESPEHYKQLKVDEKNTFQVGWPLALERARFGNEGAAFTRAPL